VAAVPFSGGRPLTLGKMKISISMKAAFLACAFGGFLLGSAHGSEEISIVTTASTAADWYYVSDTASTVAEWYYFTEKPSTVAKNVFISDSDADSVITLTDSVVTSNDWIYITDTASTVAHWIYISDNASTVAEWIHLVSEKSKADLVICYKGKQFSKKTVCAVALEHLRLQKEED
jgi:hypothetical protein